MSVTLIKLLQNEAGATAVEYGLIAALIAVAAMSSWGVVGEKLLVTFSTVANDL